MHHANHFYGHAHVFARHCGLAEPLTIRGYLQHGWNILDGFAVGTRLAPGAPLFVWSEQVARRGWSMGRRQYHAIGAAWCYLHAQRDDDSTQGDGTIFYPFHGWEGQEVLGDHGRMLSELQQSEPGPLTVCLYWTEYAQPEIRQVYEEAGCRVVTHGARGFGYRGTDPHFLTKQREELRRHRRVVSNRLSSAVLYGASLGCEIGVYGDPMVLEGEDPAFGGVARQRRLWPELHQHTVPHHLASEFASIELGTRHIREPDEIRELFDWPRRNR